MTIDRDQLIGAWRLHDNVIVGADGSESQRYGEGSDGLLLYTENGFMSVVTVRIDDRTGATNYLSYCGPFDLHDGRVVHHIEMSNDAGLVGRDNVRYPVLDGDTLTLTARPSMFGGEGTEARIVWRRADA